MGGADECARGACLVVEDRAHRPLGHFPTRFAELAEGFAENGCIVEVLTSQGWLHDGERPVPFVVSRYGRFNRLLCRARRGAARARAGCDRDRERAAHARHGACGALPLSQGAVIRDPTWSS